MDNIIYWVINVNKTPPSPSSFPSPVIPYPPSPTTKPIIQLKLLMNLCGLKKLIDWEDIEAFKRGRASPGLDK